MKAFFVVVIAVLGTGCTSPTPYMRYGDLRYAGVLLEGYRDEQIGDKAYEITFDATPYTSKDLITRHWHRRAQELCGSEHYQAEMEVVERVEQLSRQGKATYPVARGKVQCL